MAWQLDSDRPIYSQLIEQIILKICSGVYPPGSKMPSVRDLAQEAAVNPNTMQRALSKLEEEGLLYSNRTVGRFVTEDVNMVKQLRNKLAKDHIEEFLTSMTELGYDYDEIILILSNLIKEMKK